MSLPPKNQREPAQKTGLGNAPTFALAHLLGRPTKAEKPTEAKMQTASAMVAYAQPVQVNLENIGYKFQHAFHALKAREKAKTQEAAPRKTHAPIKRTSAPVADFSHLKPAYTEDDAAQDLAAEVSASAKKARMRTGTNAPAPTGMAVTILAAAEKSRQPTGTGATQPTGLAAKILAAGKKRRGL